MLPRLSRLLAGAAIGAALVLSSVSASAAPEPALWQIKNGTTTMYLFGSVHDLPRDLGWRTPVIDKAVKSADVLVFEAPLTPQSIGNMHVFVREHGTLPRGKQLSKMLSPQGLEDFKFLLARTPADPDSVNVMRPWLALMELESANVDNERVSATRMEGVDWILNQEADKEKKTVRFFETAEGQIEIVSTATPDDNIALFEKSLHEMREPDNVFSRILKTWISGNTAGMEKLLAEERKKFPEENAIVLDKRNHNWMPQIDKMLTEKHTFFITVGAAHLNGQGSVIDMLCGEGWKVQRVKTGPTEPPAACQAKSRTASLKPESDFSLRN